MPKDKVRISVSFNLGGKEATSFERLGDARIPSPLTARFEYTDDHAVELDIEIQDGTPVVNAIRIERNRKKPSLSGTELRRLPLRDWVNYAVARAAHMPREGVEGVATFAPASNEESSVIAIAADRTPRRRKITDEHLKDVARVYRAAVDDNPRDAVMDSFGVKAAMASRYIKFARERGFLGPASKGKAGEQR
jgi:hypothetical protein